MATDLALADCDAVGLYFSAHWCGPCRGFTPKLVETYNTMKDAGKKFEIVFASSDRDEAAFDEYFGEMPWLALPYDDAGKASKAALSKKFKVLVHAPPDIRQDRVYTLTWDPHLTEHDFPPTSLPPGRRIRSQESRRL